MSKYQKKLKFGVIDILGPTSSDKRCSIFEDLAELFECESSFDAATKLVNEWNPSGKKGKLDIDRESDYVSLRVSKTNIIDMAILINQLADTNLEKEDISSAKVEVKSWKQPEAFLWEKGDVFYIKLSESLTTYGQVLDKTSNNEPTCVLLSYFTDQPSDNVNAILASKPIAILHVSDEHLNNQSWVVVGREKPILKADSGPCGKIGTVGSKYWDRLEILALAWHGLQPWNKYHKDDYLDQMLLQGIVRPSCALMLCRSALEELGVKRPEWQ